MHKNDITALATLLGGLASFIVANQTPIIALDPHATPTINTIGALLIVVSQLSRILGAPSQTPPVQPPALPPVQAPPQENIK